MTVKVLAETVPDFVWAKPETYGLQRVIISYDIATDGWCLSTKTHSLLIEDRATCAAIRELVEGRR